MALWIKIALISAGTLCATLGLALSLASNRWEHETSQAVISITASGAATPTGTVSFESFEDLPTPVARYFRWALTDGAPLVQTARVAHAGEFRLQGNGDEGWRPFDSVQVFATQPPAFVWNARIRMAPLMPVRVRDQYSDGIGSILGKLLALIPVVDESGGPEMAQGSLMRYLAEAVWFPTALLPGAGVSWAPIDEASALATLDDGTTSVSLTFHFSPETGEVTGITSPGRYYQEGPGQYSLYPWEGFFWDYEERQGMMIPTEGRVQWILPAGPQAYWRGRIRTIEFDPTP